MEKVHKISFRPLSYTKTIVHFSHALNVYSVQYTHVHVCTKHLNNATTHFTILLYTGTYLCMTAGGEVTLFLRLMTRDGEGLRTLNSSGTGNFCQNKQNNTIQTY